MRTARCFLGPPAHFDHTGSLAPRIVQQTFETAVVTLIDHRLLISM